MFSIAVPKAAENHEQWRGVEFLTDMWHDTCDGLSIEIGEDDTGPTVTYDLTIDLSPDSDGCMCTKYSIDIDTAVATEFTLSRRKGGHPHVLTDTMHDRFHKAVTIDAEEMSAVDSFLTDERKALLLQLMMRIPTSQITNTSITAWSKGLEPDQKKVERTIDRLISVAQAVRPSWLDVSLKERSVLHDLFETGRDADGITNRFEHLYRGSEVKWSGELLQIGAIDRVGQRAAVLIGSADGRSASSGRVVALVALDPALRVVPGDVVPVVGSLWNLDPAKRLFCIE